MKYLILLNRKYPYLSGESFLENEIEEISMFFDKIIIYPSNASFKDKMTRMPKAQNVDVRVVERKSNLYLKILYSFLALFDIFKIKHGDFIKSFIDSYFLKVSDKTAVKIIDDLNHYNINKDDEVYLYSYWLYISAKLACILKKHFVSKGIATVAFSRAHRFDIYEEKRFRSFLPQRKQLLAELDHVFACSDNGSDYLKKHYPEYQDKISTSYLGTYDHGVSGKKIDNTFNIMSCSRITKVKRVDMIVDALYLLKNKGYSIRWTHIGDGELYDLIKKKSDSLDYIQADLKGYILNSEVYDFYKTHAIDLFINVSSSEGLPVSIMEAISFGVPVIATDVGGSKEIIIDGVNGTLLPEDVSIETLAEKIENYIIMSDAEYAKYKKACLDIWNEKFQAVKNYEEFAKDIISLNNSNQ